MAGSTLSRRQFLGAAAGGVAAARAWAGVSRRAPAPMPVLFVGHGAPTAALDDLELRRDESRGLDHGVWTPLVHLFPEADVPVLQLSLPSRLGPERLFELGRRLAGLSADGGLVVGSGNVTHNLRAMRADGSPPEAFAAEFDGWVAEVLAERDWDALLGAAERAPAFGRNHPTAEHWLPLVVAAGAASVGHDAVSFPVGGFEFGNLSRRAVRFERAEG